MVKFLYWGGVLLAVLSLQVALSGFPGLELNSWAGCLKAFVCALSGAKRELSFLLDGFDDAQQLSSVSSICGKQLVFNDCGFSGCTCQSDS